MLSLLQKDVILLLMLLHSGWGGLGAGGVGAATG